MTLAQGLASRRLRARHHPDRNHHDDYLAKADAGSLLCAFRPPIAKSVLRKRSTGLLSWLCLPLARNEIGNDVIQ
jgi:hypothetical protein